MNNAQNDPANPQNDVEQDFWNKKPVSAHEVNGDVLSGQTYASGISILCYRPVTFSTNNKRFNRRKLTHKYGQWW